MKSVMNVNAVQPVAQQSARASRSASAGLARAQGAAVRTQADRGLAATFGACSASRSRAGAARADVIVFASAATPAKTAIVKIGTRGRCGSGVVLSPGGVPCFRLGPAMGRQRTGMRTARPRGRRDRPACVGAAVLGARG